MATIHELREEYDRLGRDFEARSEDAIDASCLLCFDYEYPGQDAEVVIDSDEFTAQCPWSNLPDFGTVTISYVPDRSCLELKSLKYYLLSYRSVGIVQEHAANRLLNDLVAACQPLRMKVALDYKVRGGIHSCVSVSYERE